MRPSSPYNSFRLGLEAWQLAVEAQQVMALRLMALSGWLPYQAGENRRMVDEKSKAFTKAAIGAHHAIISGKSPDDVARAAMKPIRKKVRANRKRLSP